MMNNNKLRSGKGPHPLTHKVYYDFGKEVEVATSFRK